MLPSQKNTATTERKVLVAFRASQYRTHPKREYKAFFEHDHWWVEHQPSGAQWDAVDTNRGFDFERVSEGDEDEYGGGKRRHAAGKKRHGKGKKSDPYRCRYSDCVEGHPVAMDPDDGDAKYEPVTCQTCRQYMGLEPLTAALKKALKLK